METTCTYCQLDSAGNHNGNCPAKNVVNPIVNISTNTTSPMTKAETLRMLCEYYRFIHKAPGRNWGLAEEAEAFLKTYQSQPKPLTDCCKCKPTERIVDPPNPRRMKDGKIRKCGRCRKPLSDKFQYGNSIAEKYAKSQPKTQGVKIERKSSKVPITHPNI